MERATRSVAPTVEGGLRRRHRSAGRSGRRIAGYGELTLLAALFLIALLIRVSYTVIAIDLGSSPVTGDGPDYDNIAYHILQGQGFVEKWSDETLEPYRGDPELYATLAGRIDQPPIYSFRPPGYPLFLGATYAVFGRDFAAARILQMVLDSISVALVALLGFRWHSRRVGLLAGLLAAVNPLLIYYSRMLTAESASAFILLVLALLLTSFERSRRLPAVFGAGIAMGMLLMVKSAFLLCAPAVAAMLAWRHRGQPRHAATAVLLLTLGSLLVAGPWFVRNEGIHGRYVISTQGGSAFSQRNNEVLANTPACYGAWCPETIAGMIPDSASEEERDRLAWQIGLAFVREHPASFAKLSAYRLLRAFNPIPLGLLRGDPMSEEYAVKILGYAWVFPCFVFGFLLGWRRVPLARDVSLALFGGIVCMLALASSGQRFIVPGIPLLLTWAAFGLALLPGFVKGAVRPSG